MVKNIGVRVLVICLEGKRGLMRERYGMGEGEVFNLRDDFFVRGVMEVMEGKGVDVVINSLVGKLFYVMWGCLVLFGRFVEIGKRDIY